MVVLNRLILPPNVWQPSFDAMNNTSQLPVLFDRQVRYTLSLDAAIGTSGPPIHYSAVTYWKSITVVAVIVTTLIAIVRDRIFFDLIIHLKIKN